MAQAFEGVRVVDFTQVFAGPFATHQLALQGADVIKIEQPGPGDMARDLLDEPNFGKGIFSPVFVGLNTSKRSLAIDLKRAEAKEVVLRLVEEADVVIQNFTPGVIERLGFDYPAVKAVKPDIVYCSISGYGLEGPRRRSGAFDGAVQAASGLMATNGHPETGPTRTLSPIVDIVTGMMACFAITSALYRRLATGEG